MSSTDYSIPNDAENVNENYSIPSQNSAEDLLYGDKVTVLLSPCLNDIVGLQEIEIEDASHTAQDRRAETSSTDIIDDIEPTVKKNSMQETDDYSISTNGDTGTVLLSPLSPLTKTETGDKGNTILNKGQASTYLVPVSNISISDLVAKINPKMNENQDLILSPVFQKNFMKNMVKNNEDVTQAAAEGVNSNHGANARSVLASPSSNTTLSQNKYDVNNVICKKIIKSVRTDFYFLKISLPLVSIPTNKGKLLKVNFFIDSQPKSSKAITSHSAILREAKAPAPPMAQR